MSKAVLPSGGRVPRGPAVVYTAILVVLVVLIAGLAFSARQPAPPQIAEFAPQANQQIHKAPSQLNSSIGSGAGGSGGTTTTTAAAPAATLPNGQPVPTTTPGSVVVPAVHHCFGNPPAQIATDTQGPPCVAYWVGNNGGSTSRGVTATSINVVLPSNDFSGREMNDLLEWVNRNFELYGRQLHLLYTDGAPSNCPGEVGMADANAQSKAFLVGDPTSSADNCFFEEAARDHLVAVQYQAQVGLSAANLDSLAPYVYSYQMPYDQQFAELGAFICSQLAGKTARYSPEANLALSTRKFGLVLEYDDPAYPVTYKPLTDALARCGAPISSKDIEVYNATPNDGSNAAAADIAQFATTAMTQENLDHVTTVICAAGCGGFLTGQDFASAASNQQYYPEWIFAATNNDYSLYMAYDWGNSSEETAVLNLSFQPPQVPYVDEPMNEAIDSVDPGYMVSGTSFPNDNRGYEQLLLMASCLQMAGPDLTPTTFEQGCQAANFPNPYSPEMEGIASFAGGSHSMTTDAVAEWFNPSAPSVYPDQGPGAWCYADGAKRWTTAQWAGAPSILPSSLTASPCANTPPGM